MRIVVLIASSLLVAGCSQSIGGQGQQAEPSAEQPMAPPSAIRSTPRPTTTTPPPPAAPPATGAPISEIITWIEAGRPADPAGFHTATREGATTDLGDDVAFTTPSGKTTCMTDSTYSGGALACLVDLVDPPPRPEDAYGEWKGGWVDFDGPTVAVGSVHGDPGRFTNGDGPPLPYGESLAFGDYRCRVDQVGLFCVNYAHQSAARFSDAGIEGFGCLQSVTPPADIGKKFSC